MISENILGETRKWRGGNVEWAATVVEVHPTFALVKLTSQGEDKKLINAVNVRWSAGELSDHGFEI